MVTVKRALLSCFNKDGLEKFARGLRGLGVELIASTGTGVFLAKQGIRVLSLESFAGMTEQLDGRVKTLHPRIHAGILAKRDDPAHMQAVGREGLIDLVVVNLYPFEETSKVPDIALKDVLEQIDIGGVALLRAAAKNFPFVAVASHPAQYPAVLAALQEGNGTMPERLSRQLATDVFRLTSQYDQRILAYLVTDGNPEARGTLSNGPSAQAGGALPISVSLEAEQHQPLRYGENAHQSAAWYVPQGQAGGLAHLRQLQGKPLSYNNVLDADAAVRCVADFERPTCVIVKHASPCGVASAESAADAYRRAAAADSESAFGGIVALNRPLDGAAAAQMASIFLEVIIAPDIAPEAKARLAGKPNLRVLALPPMASPLTKGNPDVGGTTEWRSILGGWLVQEPDRVVLERESMRVVTKRQPSEQELRDLGFAWTVAKHVRSNAIVLAKGESTVGIGQGQPSRVRAVRLALVNAKDQARGAALASDGFFPFPDNVELASAAGVTAIMQPGGSVKDPEVIAAADQAGLAMVFTGIRHFRH